jgi:hypothetical protein
MSNDFIGDKTLQEIQECSDERLETNLSLLRNELFPGFFDIINGEGYTAAWLEALEAEQERRRSNV